MADTPESAPPAPEPPAPATDAHPADARRPDTGPDWQHVGPHRYYVRDDVLFWAGDGRMTPPDLMALFDLRIGLQRKYGHVFAIIDASRLLAVPNETRRLAVEFRPDPPLRGLVIIFGAGLIVRTTITLIIGAARLFGRTDLRTLHFVDDEAACWQLLDRERAAPTSIG